MAEKSLMVFGGANVDIGGFPGHAATAGDSNIGRVRFSPGGVGHNIAVCAARLGIPTQLVTALGDDHNARLLEEDCDRAGVGLAHALRFAGEATGCYLFIADPAGDMSLAVNDMAILERMTPEALASAVGAAKRADLAVIDANLPAETIDWLAEALPMPVLADAVSAAKAGRLRRALPRLAALKPNRLEAEQLTGIRIRDERGAEEAVRRLIDMGVGRVFLTLGSDGVCCGDANGCHHLTAPRVNMVNATGAGDAFTAAIAWAMLRDLPLIDTAIAGMAAAWIAVESPETTPRQLPMEAMLKKMNAIRTETGGNHT